MKGGRVFGIREMSAAITPRSHSQVLTSKLYMTS
jgi:hypothetical protein